jgi:hypothetical protein
MTSAFIPEHEVYGFLSAAGIKTPRHFFADHESRIVDAPFEIGDPVVIKGIARDLWHKSDNAALAFCDFDNDSAAAVHRRMRASVGKRFDWLGTMIAERVEFRRATQAPSEIFVSLQRDQCCGAIISFGFGGLLTEDWAREMRESLLVWPASVYTPEEAFAELREHWLGRILLGEARQQAPLTSSDTLLDFLDKLWSLDELMARDRTIVSWTPAVLRWRVSPRKPGASGP